MTVSTELLEAWLIPRPWLSLYGNWIKCGSTHRSETCASEIQKLLSDDIMRRVFSHLPAPDLAMASMTCRQWSRISKAPQLWKRYCFNVFVDASREQALSLLRTAYGHSWKRLYLEHPHVRCDGIYVSRNTYFRLGVVHWDVKNPVHLVVYYRYFRFFADGTLLVRTSADILKKVWPTLAKMPHYVPRGDNRLPGRWKLQGSTLYVACVYPGMEHTEMRCKLTLRTRAPGLNNRLDISDLFTYDRRDGSHASLDKPEEEDDTQSRNESSRGRGTLVFVPWEQMNSHIINLGKREMDVFIPG
eukprot:jgi/Ulvmu1/12450/UM009_0102.1